MHQSAQAVELDERGVVGGEREHLPRVQAALAVARPGAHQGFVAVGDQHAGLVQAPDRLEQAGQRAMKELALHAPVGVAPELAVGHGSARQGTEKPGECGDVHEAHGIGLLEVAVSSPSL